ncbi:MAG: hypothetical protein WA622_27430 [Mycobacterium sp.]|uniref:hypothetical protein n=1 Tax=Mycobacterium sp. TaxID=1785 RepID=UPI003BB60972
MSSSPRCTAGIVGIALGALLASPVDDVAGTLTPLYSFDPADFISPDGRLGSL